MNRRAITSVVLSFVLACTSITYVSAENTRVIDYQHLSEAERVAIIGKACQEDYQKTGILASVSAAQCILESGYMTTDLAVYANNCFGMKATLSGNSWQSVWDGASTYNKNTKEQANGIEYTINADFRSYASLEDSIADHSLYLLGAVSDQGFRYRGLAGEKDYRTAITIIKNGGYATDANYIDKICDIIERFNLTQFDVVDEALLATNIQQQQSAPVASVEQSTPADADTLRANNFLENYRLASIPSIEESTAKADPTQVLVDSYSDQYFRVRKTWSDDGSQLGAFYNLNYAKRACAKGYTVFDPQGKILYINK